MAICTNIFGNLDWPEQKNNFTPVCTVVSLKIFTNIFGNLDKYTLQAGQIHFAIGTGQSQKITSLQCAQCCAWEAGHVDGIWGTHCRLGASMQSGQAAPVVIQISQQHPPVRQRQRDKEYVVIQISQQDTDMAKISNYQTVCHSLSQVFKCELLSVGYCIF